MQNEQRLFIKFLQRDNLSDNTVLSYWHAVTQFKNMFGAINRNNIYSYKGFLIENYKVKTVNLRIQAINKYLEFKKCNDLKLKFIKVQQKNFLENVISDADYRYFVTCLKKDNLYNWYFIVRFLCATGARVSELVQINQIQPAIIKTIFFAGNIHALFFQSFSLFSCSPCLSFFRSFV